MTAKLSESQRAVVAHLSAAGTKKNSCLRKYRRRVRRQCPRVDNHSGISAVTAVPPIQLRRDPPRPVSGLDTGSATAPSQQMSSVEGTPGHIASAHSMSSGASREVLLDRGNVIVLSDTSSASPPSTQAERISSVEGRDAIANAHSMSSEAYREVSPGEGGVLGQFNQDVAGQSQQTTRCVDLLIPHAVAAEMRW
jgi:hypothetical protein